MASSTIRHEEVTSANLDTSNLGEIIIGPLHVVKTELPENVAIVVAIK